MAKRAGRKKNQLPHCYYEGYLEKRSFKDKTSRKLWTSLCGSTLFFFNEKKDVDYVDKTDLCGFVSVSDDGTWDRNLDAARFNLRLKEGDIGFTAPNLEARELWKGYIQSVTELSVPSSLNLLPGQIHMLREAIEKEKERVKKPSPPAVTSFKPNFSIQDDMPACYHSVSRLEAELLLEREAERGNLLLRPGSDGNSFAVTTRQDLEGSIFKHYRVTRKQDGSFAIDVDIPVPCASLHDVIYYLMEKTDKVLTPLNMEGPYERNITFIRSDKENGELSVCAPSNPVAPPSLPPKPVAPREPTPEPVPEPDECLYLNDMPEEEEVEEEGQKTGESPAFHLLKPEKKATKIAMMPPVPAPRRISASTAPVTSSTTNTQERKPRSNTDPLLQTISELKLTLEKRRTCVE